MSHIVWSRRIKKDRQGSTFAGTFPIILVLRIQAIGNLFESGDQQGKNGCCFLSVIQILTI